ncbi:MAG: RidA family protein [Phycisphaerales bacterium]|nr:RidA family protein [Phycisphaerales bacterium]
MTRIADRLAQLGIDLPSPAKPIASYVPVAEAPLGPGSAMALVSGQVPLKDGKLLRSGRVGVEVSIEDAQLCARQCVLNALAALAAHAGSLDRVTRVLKIEVFVACEPGFGDQPKVGNGASDLLVEIFGEAGKHARAAVGVPALPLNCPVEIAFTFLLAR